MEVLNTILKKNGFQKPDRIKHFTLKIYDDSDFKDLFSLFDRVFPGYMSKELFYWKDKQSPFGKKIILLLYDKDKLISAYNMEPKEFFVNGEKVACIQSLDTMTDAKYRGLGIISYMGRVAYEYVKQLNFKFVYGFPNKLIYRLR